MLTSLLLCLVFDEQVVSQGHFYEDKIEKRYYNQNKKKHKIMKKATDITLLCLPRATPRIMSAKMCGIYCLLHVIVFAPLRVGMQHMKPLFLKQHQLP